MFTSDLVTAFPIQREGREGGGGEARSSEDVLNFFFFF